MPHVGFQPKEDGFYLIHSENRGSPVCLLVLIQEIGTHGMEGLCNVFFGRRRVATTVDRVRQAAHEAIDALTVVSFQVGGAEASLASIYDDKPLTDSLYALVDLVA